MTLTRFLGDDDPVNDADAVSWFYAWILGEMVTAPRRFQQFQWRPEVPKAGPGACGGDQARSQSELRSRACTVCGSKWFLVVEVGYWEVVVPGWQPFLQGSQQCNHAHDYR